MIDAALENGRGFQQRVRKLPSRVVVSLLLAGALFAGQGWRQVWARLTVGLPVPVRCPSSAAISEAMRRVGARPLRELFVLLAGPAATCRTDATRFAGLLIVAIDGTQTPVPDTPANHAVYPKPNSGPNGEAGYPMIRLVALVATGTRTLIDAVFGSDRVSELAYATRLSTALRPGMLLLGDRNFSACAFLKTVQETGAQFLIRGKTGPSSLRLPVLNRLTDGSFLSIAGGLRVRVIDATVTITTEAGTRTSGYRFLTTILDPATAPAEHLAKLYHERWEIETTFRETKSTLLDGRVLRARHPAGIEQEVWAVLTVVQAIRIAACDAILHQPRIDPDRASFTAAVNAARDQVILAAATAADTTVDLIGGIGAAVLAALLPPRRVRVRARVIKRAISKYRAKGRDIDRRTYPATLQTQILTPSPEP